VSTGIYSYAQRLLQTRGGPPTLGLGGREPARNSLLGKLFGLEAFLVQRLGCLLHCGLRLVPVGIELGGVNASQLRRVHDDSGSGHGLRLVGRSPLVIHLTRLAGDC
jgi:hypothetical protein